ncbi:MAG: hypothetical protein HW407_527 [Bacteroidetes bacterium]|nr:hypothetical protein [Bacteroidota bacterium]
MIDLMRRFFVLSLPFVLVSPLVFAQEAPPQTFSDTLGVIDTIIVTGNKKTEAYVILDEMAIKSGSVATLETIEYDRNRIYSLGLFTRVDLFCDTLEGQRFLNVDVNERWYLIPLPLFGFRDGDPKKPYYGAGLLHNNFQGRNQKLFGSVIFGYNPALDLSFGDPLLDREHQLFFAADLSYSRIRNRSKIESSITGDFDEQHYDLNATLGTRVNLFSTVGLNVGYRIIDVDEYRPGRTASTDGRDAFLYATFRYTYDSRDLREYASHGQFVSAYVSKNGFSEATLSFTRFGADLRWYFPLPGNFTLATRAHGTVVSGSLIPTHSRAYFGYGDRIRGNFTTVFEGENLMGGILELRWPLLKARTINFTAIPIPTEFSVWRFGISLAIFADAGATWFRKEAIHWNSFASGYGGGVHFLLPYSVVVRTEYAWNEYGKGQFIIDFRTSL